MPPQAALNFICTLKCTLWNTNMHIHKGSASYSLLNALAMFYKVHFNVHRKLFKLVVAIAKIDATLATP